MTDRGIEKRISIHCKCQSQYFKYQGEPLGAAKRVERAGRCPYRLALERARISLGLDQMIMGGAPKGLKLALD